VVVENADVLVVGGGPAGSACAGRLRAGGLDVLVLDKASFPRTKLCAGWITLPVLEDLDLDPLDYARGRVFQPMTGFRVGAIGGQSLTVSYQRPVSFGIRRIEFDDYLLRRSQARLHLGEPVKTIRRDGNRWAINERFQAPMLVGAGGHFCPVARLLNRTDGERGPVIASQEFEIELDPASWARCAVEAGVPELYFCDDLSGYGWCMRKGDYLNVGLGRTGRERFPQSMADFCAFLTQKGRVPEDLLERFGGHAYLLYQHSARPLVDDGVVWIGDAAGLAWTQSGEGIGPAIASGLMAADAILAARGDFRRQRLDSYRRQIEARFGPRRKKAPGAPRPSRLRLWVARWLLGRRWFVDRVLLRRWFLRAR